MSYFEKYEIERDYLYLNDLTKPRYEHVNGCTPIKIVDSKNNIIEVDDKKIKEEIENFYKLSHEKKNTLTQAFLQKKTRLEEEEKFNCSGSYIEDKNREINFIDYRNTFYDLISLEKFTENKNKIQILKDIYKDSKTVVELLNEKFTKKSKWNNVLNVAKNLTNNLLKEKSIFQKTKVVSITTSLIGGSVRDFVLGNENKIKDLDIVINFQDYTLEEVESIFNEKGNISYENIKVYKKVEDLLNKEYIRKKKSEEVEVNGEIHQRYDNTFNDTDFAVTLKMFGVYLLSKDVLEKKYKIEDYTEQMIGMLTKDLDGDPIVNKTGYKFLTDKTFGVIKIVDEKLKYPVDILISNRDKDDFLNEFDLDICKASFVLTNKFEQKSFPNKFEHLVSRFYAKPGFLYDVLSKKITYDVKMNEEDATNKTLFDHLPRVKEKYKDYEINLWQSIKNSTAADSRFENVRILYDYEVVKSSLETLNTNNPIVIKRKKL